MAHITQTNLQRIFNAHGLGRIHDLDTPARGVVNLVMIVNDEYVVRLDVRPSEGESRFRGEQIAYERLVGNIPVPKVVALDLTKKIVPYNYIILHKLPGIALIDAWDELNDTQRYDVGYQVGEHLARMHTVTINHYGALKDHGIHRFNSVYDHVTDYFIRYSQKARHDGHIDLKIHTRIENILQTTRPLLEKVRHARVVHSDFQLENILQTEGTVTGIIDFEWVLGGDPTWDFIVEEKWEAQCAGSRHAIYDGYRSVRPLDPDHEQKLRLYKILMHLETVAASADWRGWAMERLLELLDMVLN